MTQLSEKSVNNEDNNTAILIQIEKVEDMPIENELMEVDNGYQVKNEDSQATKRLVDCSEMEDIESVKNIKDKDISFIEKIKNYFQ